MQVPGVTNSLLKPRKLEKVAVIGGGLMGTGIATALIVSNIHVILKEVNYESVQKAMKSIEGLYSLPWILLLRILVIC